MARPRKLLASFAVNVLTAMVLLFIAPNPAAEADCRTTVTAQAPGWVDNFPIGTTALDESHWINGGGNNSDYGAPGYIPNTHIGFYLASNVTVADGYLRLDLFQEEDTEGTLGVISWGALIYTQQVYGYGTYEWCMRMSSTATTPDDPVGSPTSGSVSAGFIYVDNSKTEIDFEFSGHVLNDSSNDETLYMVNWNNKNVRTDPKGREHTFSTALVPGLNSEFKSYKFIWEEGKITFYVDDNYQTDHVTDVPKTPAHFMLNHWGTNSSGWGGTATTGENGTPRYFYVDWVKYTPDTSQEPPPGNTPPTANNDSASTSEDTPVIIDVLANDTDVDGDPLTVTNLTQPASGTAILSGNTVTYTPDTGFIDTDSFTYTANDATADSNIATVTVTVGPPLEAPIVTGIDPDWMQAGTSKNVTISGSKFVAGATVMIMFGKGPMPIVTKVNVVDSMTITATVTAKSGGPAVNRRDVVVTNPDGKSGSKVDGFTVIN